MSHKKKFELFHLIIFIIILQISQPVKSQILSADDSIFVQQCKNTAKLHEQSDPIKCLGFLEEISNYTHPLPSKYYFENFEKCLEISTMRHYFSKAELYLKQYFERLQYFKLPETSKDGLNYLMWKGYFEVQTNQLESSKSDFSKIISFEETKKIKSLEDWQLLFTAFGNLSDIFTRKGDFNRAIYYLQKSHSIATDELKISQDNFNYIFLIDLLTLYERESELSAAENLIQVAETSFNPKKHKPQSVVWFYIQCSDYFLRQKNTQGADLYLLKAMNYNIANDPWVFKLINHRKAKLYFIQGANSKTINILVDLLKNIDFKNPEQKKESIFIYEDLSKAYLSQNLFDSALISAQNSHIAAARTFTNSDFKTNPTLNDVYSPKEFLDLLNLKSEILLKLSEKEPEKYLTAAYQTAQLGTQLIDTIRLSYSSDWDKANLINTSYGIFEKSITSSIALSKFKNDENIKLEAYNASEQSRAAILLNGMKDIESEKVISEADRNQLFQLRAELTTADKNLNNEKDQTIDNPNYRKIKNEMFDLNQRYSKFVSSFETKYPAYYQLKFNKHLADVREVQTQILKPNQTLLQYFVGDSSIFAFVIKTNAYNVVEIKKDFPLDDWVKSLLESLAPRNYKTRTDIYTDVAFKLYEKLVLPVKQQLSEELIIVPDGALGFIPFEALLTQKPFTVNHFKDHAYLLKDHSISYSFSATLLREMMQKKHRINTTQTILAYAPFYNGDTTLINQKFADDVALRDNLAPLEHSGEEVIRIARALGGENYVGKEVTVQKFTETAPSAKILHLSTHGKADFRSGDYSYLAFAPTKDSSQNGLVYVRDLYNLQFNADLVTLSACETGIGKFQRGEGIISLARAFAYAGAKSIVTSLWSVNDAKTKDLMLLFYKNLKQGKTKDTALREAKLKFLSDASPLTSHPFFWAGFIGIGDMTPIR